MNENQSPLSQQYLVMANASITIEFKGPGFGLSRLNALGHQSAFTSSMPSLYNLELTDLYGKKRLLGSNTAGQVEVLQETEGENHLLTLNFTHFLESESLIQVTCIVSLPGIASESEWQIAIQNHSEYAIQRVKYPLVALDQRIVEPGLAPFQYAYDLNATYSSALLLGLYDGILIPEPHTSIPDQFGWTEEHPGRIATQLLAYYDRAGGLCLYTQDGNGCPKLLGFERQGTYIDISPTHLFPREFGKDVSPGYATILAPFIGDWQAAAKTYKRWILTQSWTRQTLTERQDIPSWVKAGYPFFLYVQGREDSVDHQPNWEQTLPRQMLPVLKIYEQWLNSPLVAVIFGWEKICSWITPDVFPPYPGEQEFADLVAGLKESGSHVFLYTSGTRWAVKNPRQPDWDGTIHWKKEGRQASCVAEDGQWAYDSRPWAVNHKLCVAAEGTQKVMDQYVNGFASLGISVTQYDQNLGGESYVCYSTQHGHPPGYGSWMYVRAKEMLERFLADNRKHNPDFATSVEEPNEILIPYMSMYDSRAMVYHGWPLLTNVPCLGIPLFSYLYHEYAIGFSGDYHIFLSGKESEQVKIGRIFSAGHLMCDFLQPGELQLDPPRPALVLFKNALVASQTYAHDFQILGEMLIEPKYKVEECFKLTKTKAQSYYSDEQVDYIYPELAEVQVPAALATCWKTPDGIPGCLLINMSERPQNISLEWQSLTTSWGIRNLKKLTLQNLDGTRLISVPESPDGQLVLVLPALQTSLLMADFSNV